MERHELEKHPHIEQGNVGDHPAPHHTLLEERIYPEVKKIKMVARIVGYVGLLIAILSLFFYPYVLGVVAIVLGFFAQRKGEITFGSWAIAIGALSLIISLFIQPSL